MTLIYPNYHDLHSNIISQWIWMIYSNIESSCVARIINLIRLSDVLLSNGSSCLLCADWCRLVEVLLLLYFACRTTNTL